MTAIPTKDPEDPQLEFGLVVIGDEVLNGARADAHLDAFKSCIRARGHVLAWYWMLPDDPEVLVAHLSFSRTLGVPVFVCGGIGATPDDHTRTCAARAAGVALVRHPDAKALLESRFGQSAYPHRILMADLPAGSDLIPNPVNQIPGFSLDGHWFLPGFPQMAWPMAEWVLDRHYGTGPGFEEVALEVLEVPESCLIPIMEDLGARFPGLKLFSLPHMGEQPHVLLGFRGHSGLGEAMDALRGSLCQAGMAFREHEALN